MQLSYSTLANEPVSLDCMQTGAICNRKLLAADVARGGAMSDPGGERQIGG